MHLSPLSAWLTRLTFRFGLLRAAYSGQRLLAVVAQSRFGYGELVADGIGFELKLARSATSS